MTSLETGMPETVRGIGERLRQARVRAGITPAEAGAKLKMPTHVIEALEREDWSKIGAPVFVRGHLRSYAKLLGLPADAIAANVAVPAAKAAELVPRTYTPRMQRVAEQAGRRLVYVLITATIAVPVWLATRSHLDGGANDAVSLDGVAAVTLPKAVDTSAAGDATQVRAQPEPLVASIAPLPQRGSAMVAAGDLAVTFSGESWVRVTAPDGSIIEQALVQPGQQRVFKPGQLGQAVLGNAQAISVQYQGRPVDLAPYIRANVARFTVSSDGSLQPVDR